MKWLKEFADDIFTLAFLLICFVVIPTCYAILVAIIKLIERL
jgi:hypothetical protein